MGLTIYLLDKQRSLKRAISRGIAELIHSEGDKTLQAEITIGYRPHSGEYIAFRCVDGRHRLFEIDVVDQLDEEGVDYIEAVDASVAELRSTIATEAEVKNKNADAAMTALLAGTGWTIGEVKANGYVGNIRDAEFEPIADVMERIADTAEVTLEPYYELNNGKVTAKKIDILSREPVYRGLVVSRRNASEIILTEQGAPMGRVYAIGGWTGTGEERKRVTLESVAWSAAAGDPVDKPAGQKYIDLPGWQESYRRSFVYTDTSTDDPLALAQDAYKELQKRAEIKRTGTATAGDLSFLDGYHHSAVRVDDYAALRTQTGVVRERVANINRDYVRPELTELEFGERQSQNWIQTEYKQQQYQTEVDINALRSGYSGLRGGLGSLSEVVEDNGAELYRAIEQLVELESGTATQFNEVWIDLDAQKAQLQLKAESSTVNAVEERLSSAEILLDAVDASVAVNAEDVKTLNGITSELSAQLKVQAGEISTRVEKDGVISAINQTAETVKIDAPRIDLSGYVTASQLSASVAEILYNQSQVIETLLLNANEANVSLLDVDSLRIGDELISKRVITMGAITTESKAALTGAMDLSHSHDVTVSDDGTVTLGGAQLTGGNFNIADTKAYKDAVSAAQAAGADGVTISRGSWSGGVLRPSTSTGKSVTVQLSTSQAWSGNECTVAINDAMGTNGAQVVSTGYSTVVDATSLVSAAQSAGASGVGINSYSGWQSSGVNTVTLSNGKTGNVSLPTFASSSGSWASGNRTATVYWVDNNGTRHTAGSVTVSIPDISISWSNPQQGYAKVTVTCGGKSATSTKNISGYS